MLKPSHKHSFVTIKRNSRHRNLVIWLMKSSLILHQAKVILLLKCWGFAYGFLEDKTNLMHTESMSTSGSKNFQLRFTAKSCYLSRSWQSRSCRYQNYFPLMKIFSIYFQEIMSINSPQEAKLRSMSVSEDKLHDQKKVH